MVTQPGSGADNAPHQSAAVNPPAPAEKTSSKWTRIVVGVVVLIAGGIGVLKTVDGFVNRDTIPACDSQRAKDTLSDIHKERNVQATAYREIKTLSRSDGEALCHASLDLKDGAVLSYDFRMFKDGDNMRLEISNAKDAP